MNTYSPVMNTYSAAELDDAFAHFQRVVADIAASESRDWDRFADMFTPDADYVEHALGTMRGREEIRAWIWKTMDAFPGNHMTEFPSLWHVVDEPTGRVICEVDNPMRDPGDGSVITATNITILTYAGDGLWSREEDIYNPLRFGLAAMRWCNAAQAVGNLDDEAGAVDADDWRNVHPPVTVPGVPLVTSNALITTP